MDKAYLQEILITLKECYPGESQDVYDLRDEKTMLSHMRYLHEYGLIDSGIAIHEGFDGIDYSRSGAKITARGLDYLAEDGGLYAELGTVTVKLHPESIKDLIELSLAQRGVEPEKRNAIKKFLDTASTETVKALTNRLIDAGIKHSPDVMSFFS